MPVFACSILAPFILAYFMFAYFIHSVVLMLMRFCLYNLISSSMLLFSVKFIYYHIQLSCQHSSCHLFIYEYMSIAPVKFLVTKLLELIGSLPLQLLVQLDNIVWQKFNCLDGKRRIKKGFWQIFGLPFGYQHIFEHY